MHTILLMFSSPVLSTTQLKKLHSCIVLEWSSLVPRPSVIKFNTKGLGTRRRAWGRGEGPGDEAKGLGTRRRAWGRGEGSGDEAKGLGTRRRVWGQGEGSGDEAKGLGTRQRAWG